MASLKTRLSSDLSAGFLWEGAHLKVRGYTVAGVTSAFYLPELRVAIDVGQGLPFLLSAEHFFITHAHMDHSYGLPYLLAQKTMMGHSPPQCYLPSQLYNELPKLMEIWERLEDHKYKFNPILIDEKSVLNISKTVEVRPFATTHRVQSFGYTVLHSKQKLLSDFEGLSTHEIAKLKQAGNVLTKTVQEPLISFTGDTTTEFWSNTSPLVKNSRVIAFDTTFVDDARTIEQTRFWGHSHLSEMNDMLREFSGEKWLLIHVSARYNTATIRKQVERCIHPEFRHKVEIFPRPT